jgi:hypothetical protein
MLGLAAKPESGRTKSIMKKQSGKGWDDKRQAKFHEILCGYFKITNSYYKTVMHC